MSMSNKWDNWWQEYCRQREVVREVTEKMQQWGWMQDQQQILNDLSAAMVEPIDYSQITREICGR